MVSTRPAFICRPRGHLDPKLRCGAAGGGREDQPAVHGSTELCGAGRVCPADGSEWWWCKVGPAAGAASCAYAGHHTSSVQVCEGGEEEYDSVGSCGSHSCSDGEGGGAGTGQLASGNTTDDSGIDRYSVTLVLSCIVYCATQHLARRGGGAGGGAGLEEGAGDQRAGGGAGAGGGGLGPPDGSPPSPRPGRPVPAVGAARHHKPG